MRWLLGLGLFAASLMACVGNVGELDGDDDASTTGPNGSGGSGSGAGASSGNGASGGGSSTGNGAGGGAGGGTNSTSSSGGSGGNPEIDAVCDRWNADRANLSEGSWSGSINGCNAGDISATGRDNALRLVNLYRWLAGLPPVDTDATRNAKAQQCALMMDAQNMLSHNPPPSWACYTADGAQAAGNSNIASGPGVMAVDMYMSDFGNETTIGHRRWILSNSLGPIGLGSTSGASCMWVIGGSGNGTNAWTAFPSPGVFPIEALTTSFQSVDQTGWTIQSNSINLNNADVTVTDNGQPALVQVESLLQGYGSTYAIKITPQGWTSQAGHVYAVNVTGVSQPISYQVEMTACE